MKYLQTAQEAIEIRLWKTVSFQTILNTIIRKLRHSKPTYAKGKDQLTKDSKFSVVVRSSVFGNMTFQELHVRDPYEAQQKACLRAIEFLRTEYMIEIEDVNYSHKLYYNDVLTIARDRISVLSNKGSVSEKG